MRKKAEGGDRFGEADDRSGLPFAPGAAMSRHRVKSGSGNFPGAAALKLHRSDRGFIAEVIAIDRACCMRAMLPDAFDP